MRQTRLIWTFGLFLISAASAEPAYAPADPPPVAEDLETAPSTERSELVKLARKLSSKLSRKHRVRIDHDYVDLADARRVLEYFDKHSELIRHSFFISDRFSSSYDRHDMAGYYSINASAPLEEIRHFLENGYSKVEAQQRAELHERIRLLNEKFKNRGDGFVHVKRDFLDFDHGLRIVTLLEKNKDLIKSLQVEFSDVFAYHPGQGPVQDRILIRFTAPNDEIKYFLTHKHEKKDLALKATITSLTKELSQKLPRGVTLKLSRHRDSEHVARILKFLNENERLLKGIKGTLQISNFFNCSPPRPSKKRPPLEHKCHLKELASNKIIEAFLESLLRPGDPKAKALWESESREHRGMSVYLSDEDRRFYDDESW